MQREIGRLCYAARSLGQRDPRAESQRKIAGILRLITFLFQKFLERHDRAAARLSNPPFARMLLLR